MATDRLRRQLRGSAFGDAVASSSSGTTHPLHSSLSSENFCMIGTPLPALDSRKRDENEYKPVWQQEVRDEQGRRRFHGAFTGGFSAGYFNTVGSKEGWTPSTFYSSRKDKKRDAVQDGGPSQKKYAKSRPEDFMDEEDLADLRENQGRLRGSEVYGLHEHDHAQEQDPLMHMLGLKSGPDQGPDASGPSALNLTINPPSLGNKIMQRMGWKPGTGLGPRVAWESRRRLRELLGVKPTLNDVSERPPDALDGKKCLFPPPDAKPVQSVSNERRHGLGWSASKTPENLSQALQKARQEPNNAKSRRTGFGTSVLEDDSDGGDEVYATGNQIRDSVLANEKMARSLRWDTGKEKFNLGTNDRVLSSRREPMQRDDDESRWHDGGAMLPGFRLASEAANEEAWYPAMEPPQDWEPNPQRVWSLGHNDRSQKQETGGRNLKAEDRAIMLGETRMPGPPPSISSYLSAKDKARLDAIREQRQGDSPISQAPEYGHATESETKSIPSLEPATAKAALLGYMPFTNDPEKLERYRKYLQSQVGFDDGEVLKPSVGQSRDAFFTELKEFAKSATIFKPMSITMASRFESSAAGSSEAKSLEPGLHVIEPKPSKSDQISLATEQLAEEARNGSELASLSSERRNARMNNFGPGKTRVVRQWKPERLLCKRFNVPVPYRKGEESGQNPETGVVDALNEDKERAMGHPNVKARWEAGKRQLQQLAASRAWETHSRGPLLGTEDAPASPESSTLEARTRAQDDTLGGMQLDLENVGLGESKATTEETDYVKPPIGLFKAIFADSDTDSSEDEQDDQRQDNASGKSQHSTSSALETSAAVTGPVFQPRRRPVVPAGQGSSAQSNLSTAESVSDQKKKRRENERRKKKGRSLLTFDFEDDDGDQDQARAAPRQLKQHNSQSSSHNNASFTSPSAPLKDDVATNAQVRKGRVRASDLF